jgi:membrane fusion protein (multidrug efflux system)
MLDHSPMSSPAVSDAPPVTRPAVAPVEAPAAPKRSKRARILLVLAVVAVGVLTYLWYQRRFEETDDAQVDGNISSIGPRVTGTVTAVRIAENQMVNVGDVLFEIDPTDLRVAVSQAKAAVAQAAAQLQAEDPTVPILEASNAAAVVGASSEVTAASAGVSVAQKDVEQLGARLVEAEGNARLAESERQRAEQLWKGEAISRSDLDKKVVAAQTAAADVQAVRQALAAARQKVLQQEAQVGASRSRLSEVRKNAPRQVESRRASVLYRQANLDLARAQLEQAELNLAYAQVRAPVAGIVAKKAVNVGDHVAPGQQLIAIAQVSGLWVTANFRETQLERVRPGQAVDVHVDALEQTLTAKVDSLGGVTGSKLSLLPPENASGNYVKVVQRIPVRIRFDPGQGGLERLRPGMSVEPKIRVVP